MASPKSLFMSLLHSRVRAMAVFSIHFFVCFILLIVGGLITEGFRSTGAWILATQTVNDCVFNPTPDSGSQPGSFAAADVFRYIGYLLSLFLAIMFVICLIALRGGLCFAWFAFAEIPAFVLQFIAWIIDAADAGRLSDTGSRSYDLAIAAAILGFLASMFTLVIAISLFLQRLALAELCGGAGDCCGATIENQPVGGPHHSDETASHETAGNQTTGKESV